MKALETKHDVTQVKMDILRIMYLIKQDSQYSSEDILKDLRDTLTFIEENLDLIYAKDLIL